MTGFRKIVATRGTSVIAMTTVDEASGSIKVKEANVAAYAITPEAANRYHSRWARERAALTAGDEWCAVGGMAAM
jgi:hypothetical protein